MSNYTNTPEFKGEVDHPIDKSDNVIPSVEAIENFSNKMKSDTMKETPYTPYEEAEFERVAKSFSKRVDEEVKKNANLSKLIEFNNTENIEDFDLKIRENELSNTQLKELLDGPVNEEPINKPQFFNNEFFESMKDSDMLALFDIMNKYAADNSFDVFEALPESIKAIVKFQLKSLGVSSKKDLKRLTVMLIEQMIADMKMDKEFKIFQDEVNMALKIPDLVDMYSEHNRSLMEVKLLETANSLKETNPEKCQELLNISKAYTESYTLIRQKEYIENNRAKVYTHLNKNINKKFERFCDSFDFKMGKTQFKTHKVKEIIPVLKDLFTIDDDLAKSYVIVLCQVCENLDRTKIEDVWFMYSSLRNIISLKFISGGRTEFSELIINNVKEFLEFLHNDYTKFREV